MSRVRVEELLYFLDTAFEGSRWHSLMANLKDVSETDYHWSFEGAPSGDGRSIKGMVRHLAAAKFVYNNNAFGDASTVWADMQARINDPDASMAEDIAWLRANQQMLRDSVAALTDDDLATQRRTHWGAMLDTHGIISIMIEHDMYHAGEINHLRAIRQDTDYWAGARRAT
jgi:hypothetical protein